MITDPTQEMMTSNVISRPTNVVAELKTIVEIRKYKRFHEGHHFISMAMKVHGTPKRDMDCFIRKYAHLFHNKQLKGHLSLSFYINFSSNVLVLLFNVL
jgi:hypothetical protein